MTRETPNSYWCTLTGYKVLSLLVPLEADHKSKQGETFDVERRNGLVTSLTCSLEQGNEKWRWVPDFLIYLFRSP